MSGARTGWSRAHTLLASVTAVLAVVASGAASAEAGTVGGATDGGTSCASCASTGGATAHTGGIVSWHLTAGTGMAGGTYAKGDDVTTQANGDRARGMGTVLPLRSAPPLAAGAKGRATYLWEVDGLAGYHYRTDTTPVRGGGDGTEQEVGVHDVHGKPVASFTAPWVKDANGKPLATSSTLRNIDEAPGGRAMLTQTVNLSGAVYPVKVDPTVTWGIISGTST